MPAIKIFTDESSLVPEGSEHEYEATLIDKKQTPVQLAAIVAITMWLRDHDTHTPINKRIAQNVKDANGGVLTSGAGGVAIFTLGLDDVDAIIVDRTKAEEQHRLTLKFSYTRAGGSVGTLTRKVLYRVVNLEDIN